MITGFGNNTASALASDITANQTSITLVPGTGEIFAKLLTTDISNPSSPHRIYAKLTLTDSQQTVFEICHLTAVSNDTLTVIRGQEGTVAKGWALNDVIANFATRGSEQSFVQIEQLQGGDFTSATAGGTPNALAISLPSTFSNNNTNDWLLKTPILVTPIANNSGATTIQLTMGGRVLGTYPLVKGSNTQLRAGDIVAKNPFLTLFNAEQERFTLLNPTTNVGAVLTVNSHAPDAAGNVKLGTAADADVGTASGNVMAVGAFGLGRGPIAKTDAYSNIAQFYRVDDRATNKPPITGTSAGVICLPIDGAPTASYLAISGKGEFWIGSSTTAANGIIKWYRVYTTAYKPTAADVGAVASVNGSASRLKVTDELSINGNVLYKDNGGLWFNVSDQYFGFEPNGSMTTPSIKILDSLNMGAATRIYLDKDDLIINATENYFIFRKNGDYVAPKVFEGTARVYSPNNPQPPNTAWASVGSYAYAMWGGTGNVNFNEIVSGSNLYPSGSAGSAGGASLPGSWRCMGIATTVNDAFRSTLWVRVS